MTKALLSAFILLCAVAAPARACDAHPWLTPLPAALDLQEMPPLSKEVSAARRDEAVQALAQRSFLPVTPEEAARLTGEDAESWVPGQTFLLRGVRNAETESRYAVNYSDDGTVVVHFAVRRGDRLYAAPMVAVLPVTPAQVYVSCTSER